MLFGFERTRVGSGTSREWIVNKAVADFADDLDFVTSLDY